MPVYSYMPGLSGDVAPVAGFDYDALHFLRRAYLLHIQGLAVAPVDELGGDYEQLLEMFETTAQQSHLVWHYDHAGAYVPLDFAHPLVNDELLDSRRPLGSAHGLLRELEFVAPVIGIDPRNPPPAPAPPAGPTELEERMAPPHVPRRQPLRAGAPRMARAARGGDACAGSGFDDRLQLGPGPGALPAVVSSRGGPPEGAGAACSADRRAAAGTGRRCRTRRPPCPGCSPPR